jgi:hypothetical protein
MPSDSIPFGILLDDTTEIFLLSKINIYKKNFNTSTVVNRSPKAYNKLRTVNV